MGVLYHLSLRTTAALEHQKETLMEPGLFKLGAQGDVQQEAKEVYGPDSEAAAEPAAAAAESGERSGGSANLNKEMDLHAKFVWEWKKRKVKLEHE